MQPQTAIPQLQTIFDYMKLCGAPHNFIYVKMSVMLSCSTKRLSPAPMYVANDHINCILG